MAEQYFTPVPSGRSEARAFTLHWEGRDYRFFTDRGVFSRDELDYGSAVLLRALPEQISGDVLDLGCGWGPIGILIAARHPEARVLMVDVNERAVALSQRNAAENGVTVQVGQSDGFERVQGQFDLIALNPPIRAGKQVVYGLFAGAAARLRPGGAVYVVMRRQQGADSAARYLKTIFDTVDTVARKGGYHVFCCRGGQALEL